MTLPPLIADFWSRFRATAGADVDTRFHEAFHFCDDEASANELAALVMAGTKRATAGLVWSYEHEDEALPQVGLLSVVTNWAGEPLCVIESTSIEIVPFQEVTAEFAAIEGEGDGSLKYWREGHWRFFSRECARIGREPRMDMPIVCECFDVIYRETT